MKVLFFLPMWEPAWQFGGPIRSTYEICKGVQRLGVDVRVVTTTFGLNKHHVIPMGKGIERSGVLVTYYPATSNVFSTVASPDLIDSFEKHLDWADIFHTSSIWHPIGLKLQDKAVKCDVPFVHSIRGALSKYSFSRKSFKKVPYYYLLEQKRLLKASALHVTSKAEYNESIRPALKLPSAIPRLIIPNISNICNSAVTASEKQSFLARNLLSEDIPTLLICGRIDHKKGLDLIPKILKMVDSLPWNLLVVGPDFDGSLSKLMSALRPLYKSHQICYLGLLPPFELKTVYSVSNLLLMPSLHENFGNVALEALGLGCQVLLSRATGIASYFEDLITNTNWGAALPRDQYLWAAWLTEWLSHSRYRTRFVFNQDLNDCFSSHNVASKWITAYSGILS